MRPSVRRCSTTRLPFVATWTYTRTAEPRASGLGDPSHTCTGLAATSRGTGAGGGVAWNCNTRSGRIMGAAFPPSRKLNLAAARGPLPRKRGATWLPRLLHTRLTSRSPRRSVRDRIRLGERLPNRSSSSRTLGVAEPAGTDTVRDVVDDVVVAGVAAGLFVGDSCRHVVEPEIVANLLVAVVIGALRVSTHTKAAHERPVSVVQRETAAEHVGAPDPLPYHEVFRGAVVGRVAAIRHLVVRRDGFLEPEQRSAGLAGGVEVGGRA